MSSMLKKGPSGESDHTADTPEHPPEEAQEIVRAIRRGEVDAVVVEASGEHELMALARLKDLDEVNELARALRQGEIDAFIAEEEGGHRIYSVTPVHHVLAQQYSLTKSITDNATTALFILDEKQQCVFMNPAAENLTGYTLDELRVSGQTFHELVHHSHPDGSPYPASECPINHALPAQEQIRGEELLIHKSGRFFDVAFAASPIRDATGDSVGTVIEVRDITSRKQIEAALRDAARRKDEFIATLAHELRNPLAPISNLLTLMKQAEDDTEFMRRARDTIERQLSKMVRLVDDLLDVSRITRNSIELRLEPVELKSAIRDAVEMCKPLIDQFGHKLSIELPAEPVYLNADSARLSQVLGNLINNACKFTPAGGSVNIAAERVNGDVMVRVIDTGIGIPPEQLANIFDMFAQASTAHGDNASGLGIGLALAKQLTEMHGGSIEAKSGGDNVGSEFIIRLPVLEGVFEAAPQSRPAERPASSGWRILVVDDNLDSAESMATLLEMTGNECRMAHGGHQALEIAESFQPQIMLLDIGLPGMDGYEVCKTIRQTPWGRSIKIIAMTGWGQAEDRQRSNEAGFDAHLVKPVDIDKMYELIDGTV